MVENGQDTNFYNAEALFRFVFRLFFFFLQIAQFHTANNTMVHKKVLKKTRHSPPFPIHGRIASEILVPPIAPSDLQYCGIIDLEYEVVVTVHVSGPYVTLIESG